jgi:hypothetical protein
MLKGAIACTAIEKQAQYTCWNDLEVFQPISNVVALSDRNLPFADKVSIRTRG